MTKALTIINKLILVEEIMEPYNDGGKPQPAAQDEI